MNARACLLNPLVATLPHLPWLLAPYVDESLASFTGRHCAYNALHNPLVVINDAGLLLTRGYGYLPRASGDLSELATILGIDRQWVEAHRHGSVTGRHGGSGAIVDFHGATLRRAHMNYSIRRIAPSLVQKTPYHREIWHVHTLAACAETGEMLVERCQADGCDKELVWNEVRGIGHCSNAACPGDLHQLRAVRIADDQLGAFRAAAALIHPDPAHHETAMAALPDRLQGENRGDLFELAWLLGCLDLPEGAELALYPSSASATVRVRALCVGAQRLATWPASLRSTLRAGAQGDETGATVQRMVKVIQTVVRRPKTYGHAVKLIENELEGIRGNRYPSVVARELNLLTATEFAQAAGLKSSQLASAQRSGSLPRLLLSEGGRDIALFKPGDADTVRVRLKTRMSAQRFAYETGLGIDAVELLVVTGVLKEVRDPIIQALWNEQHLDPEVAASFRAHLEGAVLSEPIPEVATRLCDLLCECPPGEKPWPAIVSAVLSGRLALFLGRTRNLDVRGCFVDADGAKLVRGLAALENVPDRRSVWLSDPDARERLSVSSTCLRAMSAAGKLATSGDYSGQTYIRAEVDAIAQQLVSQRELQAKLGVTRRELNRILRQAGLGVDDCRFLPRLQARTKLGLMTI